VRGEGLLTGIKTRVPNTEFQAAARAAGLLSVGAGDNVVRLIPPLTITEADLSEAMVRLERAAQSIEAELSRAAAE
jgi:acetylornithine/N-succinyldiaminopimelate aminotransferase